MNKCREAYNKILRETREQILKSAREEGWNDEVIMGVLEASYTVFEMGWNEGKSSRQDG
ncbi:MAG: hypothetical protein GY782_04605 [Gammaproteobacteria bacterium]|nr:hypothetical protein [Gammaproteobacteria bacterium]